MSVTEEKFSEKFEAAAKSPKNRGAFYQEEATENGMALEEIFLVSSPRTITNPVADFLMKDFNLEF
jgi:hypothetical protein